MKTYKTLFTIGALALAAGFTSCSDDEEYDFPGTTQNFVYHQDKTGEYELTATPVGVQSDFDASIFVKCTRPAESDINVTFAIDNSLVEKYNEEHNTDYLIAPDGVLVFDQPTVTIPKGGTSSSEQLHVTVTDNLDLLHTMVNDAQYLIPLVRSDVKGGNAIPSEDVNPVSYIVLTYYFDNVRHGKDVENEIRGTEVADQSGWSVTCNIAGYETEVQKLLDGDYANYFRLTAYETVNIDIDMGKSYTFDAMTMCYGYHYTSRDVVYGRFETTQIIYISDDGQNWTDVGAMKRGDSDLYKVFYTPLTARYVRICLPYTSRRVSLYAGYFNIYAL